MSFVSTTLDVLSRLTPSSNTDDLFENETDLFNLLDLFATLSRAKYFQISHHLLQIFDSLAAAYSGVNSSFEHQKLELQFTWCVYVIGAALVGRTPYQSTDEHDMIDAELTCKVLQLIHVVKSKAGDVRILPSDIGNPLLTSYGQQKAPSPILASSFLFFFQQFRKTYIGDQANRASKFYTKLGTLSGLSEQVHILNLIVENMYALFFDFTRYVLLTPCVQWIQFEKLVQQ